MGKWEMVKLGDIVEKPQSGEWGNEDKSGTGVPVLRTTNFTDDGIIDYKNVVFREISPKKFEKKALKFGDIIIEKSGGSDTKPVGRVVYYDGVSGQYIYNNFTASLRVNTDAVDTRYIFLLLFCYYKSGITAKYENKTTGIHNLRLNDFLDGIKIPLPPLDEQKRIAKNLDLASEIVKGYKEQLAELDRLVQSVFYEMFGDPVTNEKGWISQSLLDFGSCKNGMNFGANENGIDIKYLGVGHFKELSIIDEVDNLSTISLKQAPSKEYLLRDEDIIFVRSNGNKNLVGRCVVVYPGDAALTFSGFCIRFRNSSDKLMTIYLLYVLKCASVRRLLLGRGANIQNLNQQILKQLKVPIPPISLQAQFVEIITEIENQKAQIQQALTEAENLFNSLMQEYFE